MITLTTDFGEASHYVAALKGVVLTINPAARLHDLSHQIPAQDLLFADYFLANAVPYFPPGTIHVVVVDPGVGTDRALLHVAVAGHVLLVPDNGCWTSLARLLAQPPRVRRLTEHRFWRTPISATFHGRDVLAPVAAWLSRGVPADALGPSVQTWTQLSLPQATRTRTGWEGQVLVVDSFGNLITNIPGDLGGEREPTALRFSIADQEVVGLKRAYGQVAPNSLVALTSSSGHLEIAEVNGNAAARLKVGAGAPVRVAILNPSIHAD